VPVPRSFSNRRRADASILPSHRHIRLAVVVRRLYDIFPRRQMLQMKFARHSKRGDSQYQVIQRTFAFIRPSFRLVLSNNNNRTANERTGDLRNEALSLDLDYSQCIWKNVTTKLSKMLWRKVLYYTWRDKKMQFNCDWNVAIDNNIIPVKNRRKTKGSAVTEGPRDYGGIR